MNTRTLQLNEGPVITQIGPLYLSLRHTGDEPGEGGEVLHRYSYLVINQQPAGQRYRATDLHNQGPVDTDAAMCYLLGHLWAVGHTVRNCQPDGSMDYLPQWLRTITADYLDELLEGMELHEEVLVGPTDKTFDFDDPES
ncbi:hypothetical protein [Promicromonospora sp. NPDC090134]|uniref:hypothetical protein n=1 Tax=Promicromonospora sp. NPDC090134 TaxID=3364408 RepID=UPI0037FC17C8